MQFCRLNQEYPSRHSSAMRKYLDDSGKEKLEAMLLAKQKKHGGDGTLKDFGARQFIEATASDFRPFNEYAEHARAIGLNLRIREDAYLR
jgi:ABC-type phosphate/phosphonate transport system substrate-binding protein